MTTHDTQEQKVDNQDTTLVQDILNLVHTAYSNGEKAGYTRALEDKEVKAASCCHENEERVRELEADRPIALINYTLRCEVKELQSNLDASNARLDKARAGLKSGCNCRPGGGICNCCLILKDLFE